MGSLFPRWNRGTCWLYCSPDGGFGWTNNRIGCAEKLWAKTSWSVYMVDSIGSISRVYGILNLLEYLVLLNDKPCKWFLIHQTNVWCERTRHEQLPIQKVTFHCTMYTFLKLAGENHMRREIFFYKNGRIEMALLNQRHQFIY